MLLGLLAFTLVALVRPQPGAPTLQVSRFVVWLAFGIMGLALFRMLPFFALVAAPLTAMTLGEFLHWQQVSNKMTAAQQDRGMHLARFVGFLLLLVLLYMAWPGWLHVWGEHLPNADRRVAWEIREDASMRRAAETLQTLKEKGEGGNVFNVGFEFAPYCAWYAPDVKCFLDTRFALFAHQTAAYTLARRALLEQKNPEDWETLFQKHEVDQVILGRFVPNLRRDPSAYGAWLVNYRAQCAANATAMAASWSSRWRRPISRGRSGRALTTGTGWHSARCPRTAARRWMGPLRRQRR